ncbi:hypothetical protein K474DRAFT_395167 [Panus rudis PR-1116 ss-1]|nr:hypothetical protein K474DRAFT_395167 [Panus rudis PR-1116 ss-1]
MMLLAKALVGVVFTAIAHSGNALVVPHAGRGIEYEYGTVAIRASQPELKPPMSVGRVIQRKRCEDPASSSDDPSSTLVNNVGAVPPSSTGAPAFTAAPTSLPSESPAPTSQAPIPQSTEAPGSTTVSEASQPPARQNVKSTSGGGGGSDVHTGDGTFYNPGLGACGTTSHNEDFMAAIAHEDFDNYPGYHDGNPNHNPICGKKVRATCKYDSTVSLRTFTEFIPVGQGKSVEVTIVDRCGDCAPGALDFSPAAFDQLASESVGRLHGMTWTFI